MRLTEAELIDTIDRLLRSPRQGKCWCRLGLHEIGWWTHSADCSTIQERLRELVLAGKLNGYYPP